MVKNKKILAIFYKKCEDFFMKTHKREKDLKKILHAAKRINELYSLFHKTNKIKLENPIFAGYWRFFKVRADILRSSIGNQVQRVVDATNTYVLGKTKKDGSFRCAHEIYCKFSFEVYYRDGQYLKSISEEEFEKANFPDFFKNKWFDCQIRHRNFGTKNKEFRRYFPKIPTYMLEFDYKKGYITEVSSAFDHESELIHLLQFMDQNNGWQKISGRHLDEWNLSLDKKKKLEKILNREMSQEILTS